MNDEETQDQPQELEQVAFVDLSLGRPELQWVSCSKIPVGPQLPTKEMVESVENYGVMLPVVLFTNNEGEYEIAGGSRVHMAAVEAGLTEIPALVYSADDWDYYSAARIALNSNRSPSPIAELDAIVALISSGLDEAEIAHATGIPIRTVRRRLALNGLREPLRIGLQSNRISLVVADSIAKLTEEQQVMLEQRFIDNGKVTSADIKDVVLITTPEQTVEKQKKMKLPDDWREMSRRAATAAIQHDVPLDMLISLITAEYGTMESGDSDYDG